MVAIGRRDVQAGDPGRRKSLSADGSLNRTAFLSGQRSTASAAHQGADGFTHGTADPFGSIDELRAAAALIPARPGRKVVTSPHSAVMRLRQMLYAD